MDLGITYLGSWVAYVASQPYRVREIKWDHFRHNVGDLARIDGDRPIWNMIIHPFTGSQLFLFYRARGYSSSGAFIMTGVSSFIFEEFVETFTEKPSLNDMVITPVFGSVLGVGLYQLSAYLLVQESSTAHFFGKILNPWNTFTWIKRGNPAQGNAAGISAQINFE